MTEAKKYFKICALLSAVFFFFEVFSRAGKFLFPLESHQRYAQSAPLNLDDTESYSMRVNGRGAMGALYRGQEISIAFFGNSSLYYGVPLERTWPEQIKLKLNSAKKDYGGGKEKGKIHVDNFAAPSNSPNEMRSQMEILRRQGRRYRIAVAQYTYDPFQESDHYFLRWSLKKGALIQSPQQIKKWLIRRSKASDFPFSNMFQKTPLAMVLFRNSQAMSRDKFLQIQKDPALKKLWSVMPIFLGDALLYPADPNIRKDFAAKAKAEMAKVAEAALEIAETVIWAPAPFSNSLSALKGYESYFFPFPETFEKQLLSVVDGIPKKSRNFYYSLTREEIESHNDVIFVDWKPVFEEKQAGDGGFFIDDIHITAKGHDFAAEYMYPLFYEILKHEL